MLETVLALPKLTKEEYHELYDSKIDELMLLQQEAITAGVGVVVLFEGWELADVGGRMSDLLANLDARSTNVHTTVQRLSSLVSNELLNNSLNMVQPDQLVYPPIAKRKRRADHFTPVSTSMFPLMDEFWGALCPMGKMTLYNRGWYSASVFRLFYLEQAAQDTHKKKDRQYLRNRYESHARVYSDAIVDFEDQLVKSGYTVVKFFLQIDRDEQERRIRKNAERMETAFKVNAQALAQNESYEDFAKIYEDLFASTEIQQNPWASEGDSGTAHPRWTFLDASDERRCNVTILDTMMAALRTAIDRKAKEALRKQEEAAKKQALEAERAAAASAEPTIAAAGAEPTIAAADVGAEPVTAAAGSVAVAAPAEPAAAAESAEPETAESDEPVGMDAAAAAASTNDEQAHMGIGAASISVEQIAAALASAEAEALAEAPVEEAIEEKTGAVTKAPANATEAAKPAGSASGTGSAASADASAEPTMAELEKLYAHVELEPRETVEARIGVAPKHSRFTLVESPKLEDVSHDLVLPREEYSESLKREQKRLLELQQRCFYKKIPLMVAFEGWDAAGKGGCIKRVARALNAGSYHIFTSPAPTASELAHPFLWRYWTRLPRAGAVALYDRTWYGRVLVERIEGFAKDEDWQRAYDEINGFEQQMATWGAVIAKFWVNVSPDTQLERFKERETNAYRTWKIQPDDWRNRAKYSDYWVAVDDMLRLTSTPFAPWTILEADDKSYARVKALATINDAIEAKLASFDA